MSTVLWLMVAMCAPFVGALVGELTDSVGWGFVACFGLPVAVLAGLLTLIVVLDVTERVLVRTGYYRWSNARRVKRIRKRNDARRQARG